MSIGSLPGVRRLPRPRIVPRRLLSLRGLAALCLIALAGGLGWLWFRDSSLVRVRRVRIIGVRGQDAAQIRSALTRAALTMTTLDVQMSQLNGAVSGYPFVHSLRVSASGRHALVIRVDERIPVARAVIAGRGVVVDGDGLLLPQATVAPGALPLIPLTAPPPRDQITGAGMLAVLSVLQGAPARLLAHVQSAAWSASRGVRLQLRNGPELYFGAASQISAKWAAVIAVLASSDSGGAAYIDVTQPNRPAAGVTVTGPPRGSSSTTAGGSAQGGSTGTTTAGTPAGSLGGG